MPFDRVRSDVALLVPLRPPHCYYIMVCVAMPTVNCSCYFTMVCVAMPTSMLLVLLYNGERCDALSCYQRIACQIRFPSEGFSHRCEIYFRRKTEKRS
jgi:hypothetical protein